MDWLNQTGKMAYTPETSGAKDVAETVGFEYAADKEAAVAWLRSGRVRWKAAGIRGGSSARTSHWHRPGPACKPITHDNGARMRGVGRGWIGEAVELAG